MAKDKTSSARQNRLRAKRRAEGLVSMQVWVPSWGRAAIRDLEARLRNQHDASQYKEGNSMSKMTIDDLMAQLQASEEVLGGEIAVEKIDGETPVIRAVVEDMEEFPIMVTVGQEQMLAIAHLWSVDEVKDGSADALNGVLLRANLPVPLSSFSIMNNNYVIFGALSANSGIAEVIEEITMLATNVVDALEFCQEYLNDA